MDRSDVLASVRDYARCAVANRVTLAGFTLMGGAAGALATQPSIELREILILGATGLAGGVLAHVAGYGRDTFRSYRSTVRHIRREGTVEGLFERVYERHYCHRAGIRLAAREHGLEDQLPY